MAEETLDVSPDETSLVEVDNGVNERAAPDTTKAEPDTKVETKVEVKSDVKPDTKAEVKADLKPDAKSADWPEDWREKASGGDAKVLGRLARYASPKALADALLAAQNKLASTRPVLGKDATAEQIKEYRDALGIPETADKYDISGFKIGEADKDLIAGYLEKAHATNQTPEQVNAGIEAYMEINGKLAEARHTKDATFQREAEDALRGEWGQDYRRNITLVNAFLDSAPEGLKSKILSGRLSDGTPIGSDPDALRWLLQLELDRNPVGVVAPGAGANMAQTVDDEIKKIETTMRENRKAYDKDEKLQQRYRDLLTYRIEQSEKGKKAA